MMRIFRFVFSILLFSWFTAGAQTDEKSIGDLRFGFDISRIAVPFIESGRVEYDGSIDLMVKNDLYPVIEVGWGELKTEELNFSYRSSGYSLRAGIDKNYLNNENVHGLGIFFAGFRYGISFFKHEAPYLEISDPYWGDLQGSVTSRNMNAHWLELTTGIRAKVFKNFYLGWSLRGKLLIHKSEDNNMSPDYIPGYGKVNGKNALGFRYSVFYQIPL